MRTQYLQHVLFEGLGNIENWAFSKRHQISDAQLYNNDPHYRNRKSSTG